MMHTVWVILMVAVILIIGMMLLRVFQGPTVFDRMNGLGVIGADVILLLVLYGYVDGWPEMYVDIAMAYAMIGFLGSVITAKYLGGKDL